MTRIATVRVDGALRAARLEEDEAVLLPYAGVKELLQSDASWLSRSRESGGDEIPHSELVYAPLVTMPEKIVCVGLNYRSHAREAGLKPPDYPQLFAKYGRALIGANDEIMMPRVSETIDWEAELGIVIGRPARHVSETEASDCIAGYTVANDVSVREWQRRTSQYLQGKTFERTTPVGPWLLTRDEIDPGDLRISCSVEGETVQEVSTADMIFSPAFLVAYISRVITLAPGDLILTGTGPGVGASRKPPRFLMPGSVLRTSIEGLGLQENRCVLESK